MRRCDGFSPSLASGRARWIITLMAYVVKDSFISSPISRSAIFSFTVYMYSSFPYLASNISHITLSKTPLLRQQKRHAEIGKRHGYCSPSLDFTPCPISLLARAPKKYLLIIGASRFYGMQNAALYGGLCHMKRGRTDVTLSVKALHERK